MKKLLILAAILFMTPIASGMTVWLTATETSLELNVSGATYDPFLAIVVDVPGVLSNFAAGPEAPSAAMSMDDVIIYGASGEVWGFGAAAGEPYVDGVWLTADWSPFPGWTTAYETLDGGTTWIYRDMIIPEPATLLLLGLGAMLLRKRRQWR